MFNNDTCPNYRLVTVIKTSADILGKTTKAMYDSVQTAECLL